MIIIYYNNDNIFIMIMNIGVIIERKIIIIG